ncbi:MAG: phosphoglycerate dehydrogenase [Anaerolineales bacterium]|nr:phosphoglycerate dehydrogenase [Anaerolineales bacterium]
MKPLHECRVLVTPTSYGSQDPALKPYLEKHVGEVIYNPTGKPLSGSQLIDRLHGVDGFIAGLDQISADVIQSAKSLKVISRYGVGFNNVDLDAAKANQVVVTNTPGANAKSVAELAVGLILNLLRPIIPANAQTKSGEWPRFKGVSLEGKTVGLLGLGAIGKETARRLAGFDCKLLAFEIFKDEEFAAKYGISFLPLEEILPQADVISLHLPGNAETTHMVNDEFLGKMKAGAVLVNTARGELIDEAALVRALESGHLKGAGLDAFRQEPPGAENPLLAFDQVIATPHMGAHSDSSTNAMGWISTRDCLAVLLGEEPKYRVV